MKKRQKDVQIQLVNKKVAETIADSIKANIN